MSLTTILCSISAAAYGNAQFSAKDARRVVDELVTIIEVNKNHFLDCIIHGCEYFKTISSAFCNIVL